MRISSRAVAIGVPGSVAPRRNRSRRGQASPGGAWLGQAWRGWAVICLPERPVVTRNPLFAGYCYVCGWPVRKGSLFWCVAHSDLGDADAKVER